MAEDMHHGTLRHWICYFDGGFASKRMLADMLSSVGNGYKNAVILPLCHLPGINGSLHCHCGNASSLQCLARAAVLRQLFRCVSNDLQMHVPYFYCCSRFVVYRIMNYVFIKCLFGELNAVCAALDEVGVDVNIFRIQSRSLCK